jgi:rhamnopyranosyl-N-acetylglucosaminyl-diphospho-decaprenol beta-1,3/1,4-galactofuranosyltransferase
MPVFVVVLVATYRRAPELARLLSCLEKIPEGLGAVVVVDNASDPATAAACQTHALEVRILPQEENLGCGGGLRKAEESALALFGERLTHVWILDDDAVVPPNCLDGLLAALAQTAADAAAPMILDDAGHLGWFPGLLDEAKFRAIRMARTPEDYLMACGGEPVFFSWATGICLLVSRRALETVGPHRTDFWIRGEDLEFSLRITALFRGVFVPTVVIEHLSPVSGDAASARRAEYWKQCAHMQNATYAGLYLSHGQPIRGKIPGHYYRFLRDAGWRLPALRDALRAFWWGAVRAKPAGSVSWGS